jgi:anthranilate phosphoribosyltransferase
MLHLMRMLMRGEMSPAIAAALLMGLRVKKETVGEITAAATVMREFATPVKIANPQDMVDMCGTGGDGSNTFNISTTAMFVAAAAGVPIAKHGGRSASSSSGSADVLEALGANLALTPEQIAECIEQTGIGFMFAQAHHGAMKNIAPIRKELGVRTIFNILGPLTNPAPALKRAWADAPAAGQVDLVQVFDGHGVLQQAVTKTCEEDAACEGRSREGAR